METLYEQIFTSSTLEKAQCVTSNMYRPKLCPHIKANGSASIHANLIQLGATTLMHTIELRFHPNCHKF